MLYSLEDPKSEPYIQASLFTSCDPCGCDRSHVTTESTCLTGRQSIFWETEVYESVELY